MKDGASLPLSEVFDAWNGTAGLSKCLVLSDKRRQTLKVRLGEPFFAANWRAALEKVEKSAFCLGDNDRGWKASFDWFISRDVVAKIMEGKYDNGKASKVQQSGVTAFAQHKELERVSERMKTIKSTYSGHQTWAEDDIEEFRKLRDRKNELKAILGVKL